jgi:hypothetical protein
MKVFPVRKLHFEFARRSDGTEIKEKFIMSMGKHFGELKGTIEKEIMSVEGIDFFQPVGRYSAEVIIAKTYDPDAVIKKLTDVLEPLMTDIVIA